MKIKKAQASASGAAILVAIIAAMIVFYLLFLPPDERAKLLEENLNDNDNNDNSLDYHEKILLEKNPGRLDLIKTKSYIHDISPFNLISTTKGIIIKKTDSIYTEKTLFNEKTQDLEFVIEDVENADNIILSFENIDYSGRLIISLNGNIISDKKIEDRNPSPLRLEKDYIRESNKLTFSTSSPGVLFFKTNRYNLENIKIFADITDNSGLENTQTFFVTNVEKDNTEKVILSFMADCLEKISSSIEVIMNRQTIYNGIPECDLPIKLELASNKIIDGENQIKFESKKASYGIHQIEIETRLKEEIFPTYYFEIENELFDLIDDDEIDINMTVIFVTDKDFQDVEIEINGRKFSIDNKERIYTEIIDPYLRKGNNALTLRPLDGTVEVVEVRIQAFDKDR